MRISKYLSVNSFALALVLMALVAVAPTPATADGDPEGQIMLGYRWVDVDGAERKFREDLNQEDGPILYQLDFDLVPEGEDRWADRIELDVNDLGSRAFETVHLGIRKYGAYTFKLDRRRSEYFYEDIIVPPELANVRASTGGDFHHFDFERVRTRAALELFLNERAKLSFDFDQHTKDGESTTTLDISRDEFEADRPIDETLQTSTLGFSYTWDKATLILEERLRDYENVVEVFLPGFSEGETPGPATLDFYFFDQPYDYESREHAVKVLARPNDRLDVRFGAELHDLSLNLHADERSQGIDFRGNPFSSIVTGSGDIDRDLELYDLELTCNLNDRVAMVGSVRTYSLEQTADSTLGSDVNEGQWDIETTGYEAGFVFFLDHGFTLGAGLMLENREVSFRQFENDDGITVDDAETDNDGYYVNALWKPRKGFELSAKIDVNTIDDPVTLATATDRSRYRIRARNRWDNGVTLSAVYQITDFENDSSGWQAETEKIAIRVGCRVDDVEISAGYTLIDIERQIDSLVNEVLLFDDLYRADTDFLDARVRWAVNDRLTLGAAARLYENDGSFALEREEYRAFLETRLMSKYLLGLTYRTIDYDEVAESFDDYSADIAEISIGYRF